MASNKLGTHRYSNYLVIPEEVTVGGVKYRWYTKLYNQKLRFTSLADAKDWCSANKYVGIVNGWI